MISFSFSHKLGFEILRLRKKKRKKKKKKKNKKKKNADNREMASAISVVQAKINFTRKVSLDLNTRETIRVKCQSLFSWKNKKKRLNCRLQKIIPEC